MAKKTLHCQICGCAIEKSDAQFVDEETFAFLKVPPAGITLGIYCSSCFDREVRDEVDAYNDKMERAKKVNMFYLSQSRESRFVRRVDKPVQVSNCVDRDEVILRLAFLAVEANKNALVDVDLSSVKVRNGGWQSSRWSGRAIPVNIEESDLQRRFMSAPN